MFRLQELRNRGH